MSLEYKIESAIIALLGADATVVARSLTIVRGMDSDDLAMPAVIVTCDGYEEREEVMATGTFNAQVSVTVATSHSRTDPNNPTEDRRSEHESNFNAVFDALAVDDVAGELSDLVEDFYIYEGSITTKVESTNLEGLAFTSTIIMNMVCCEADLVTE